MQPLGYTVVASSTSGATRRYCDDTKVPGAIRIYFSGTRVPVEPTEDKVMMLGTSVAARIYFSDTRFPVEPQGDTLVTLV